VSAFPGRRSMSNHAGQTQNYRSADRHQERRDDNNTVALSHAPSPLSCPCPAKDRIMADERRGVWRFPATATADDVRKPLDVAERRE
jgi:hypothetical protein